MRPKAQEQLLAALRHLPGWRLNTVMIDDVFVTLVRRTADGEPYVICTLNPIDLHVRVGDGTQWRRVFGDWKGPWAFRRLRVAILSHLKKVQ
jgi:hypothetical protein